MPRLSSKTKVHMRIKPTLVERQSEGHLWWSQRKTAISAALYISVRKDDWLERNQCAARMYQHMMEEIHSPITTIPGIGCRMGAMILAEAGDLSRFDSPDKLLAYAGMSPSTYQSGQLKNCYPHMEKRGSRYLRYALFNATKYVCLWDPTFSTYLAKKRAEGKHYNVAISHAAKKLVRLIFAMEKSRQPYRSVT